MKKSKHKQKIPLFLQLSISYGIIIISLVVILLIGRELISNQFKGYLSGRFHEKIDELEESIEYTLAGNEIEYFNSGRFMFDNYVSGYTFKIYDIDGVLQFDSTKISKNNLSVNEDKQVVIENSKSKVRIYSEIRELSYKANDGKDVIIGTLEIEYRLVNEMSPADAALMEEFLDLYRIMILVIVFIMLGVNFLISRSVTKPIKKFIETTDDIRQGDYKVRVDVKTYTKEIIELEDAINYMSETLQTEDELRSQMTSDMAHEIRTPINNVQNILEAMLDGVWERDDETLEKCYKEVLRLGTLVTDLKSISTIEENNLVTKDEIFNAVDNTKTIISLFEASAAKKNISIHLESPTELNIMMDQEKYSQILGNLISNSIRYTDESGIIEVFLSKKAENLHISVRDNGIGIAKEHLTKIFERFYRTDESRTKSSGGLGLGLTITQKIIKRYHGTIDVNSEVNKYSEFHISIPVIKI